VHSAVPCKLQFIANRLFSGIKVSQGSVTTYAECGETHITTVLQICRESSSERISIIGYDLTELWP